MRIGPFNKQQSKRPEQRTPHIARQKQSSFQYSSNRSQTDRVRSRTEPAVAEQKSARRAQFLKKITQLPYIVGGVGGLFMIFYFSALSGAPHIATPKDARLVRDVASYQKTASDLTSDPSSKSKFAINRQKIEEEFEKAHPEVMSAKVTTSLFSRSATIELQLTTPLLLLNSGSVTYVLDNRGTAVSDISKTKANFDTAELPLITDQSGIQIEIGKPALTSEQVAFASEVRHQSSVKQLNIESMTLVAGGGELNVKYGSMPYFVKYNLNEDARKSFGTFFAAKEYLEQSRAVPAEYIDVRIPERAYTK